MSFPSKHASQPPSFQEIYEQNLHAELQNPRPTEYFPTAPPLSAPYRSFSPRVRIPIWIAIILLLVLLGQACVITLYTAISLHAVTTVYFQKGKSIPPPTIPTLYNDNNEKIVEIVIGQTSVASSIPVILEEGIAQVTRVYTSTITRAAITPVLQKTTLETVVKDMLEIVTVTAPTPTTVVFVTLSPSAVSSTFK